MKNTARMLSIFLVSGMCWTGQAQDSWVENFKLSGDMRLRQEFIDQDGKDERNRTRLRARVAMDAKVNDEVKFKARFASGANDPKSTNQSFDEGFSTKDLRLDRAYVVWAPAALGGASLQGGKMANLFVSKAFKRDLIWDSDVNPEGLAIAVSQKGEGFDLFANAGAFLAEESSGGSDVYLYGGQVGADLAPEAFKLHCGVSYFYWDGLKGYAPLFDPEDSFGNDVVETLDPVTGDVTSLAYAEDFAEVEVFAKVSFDAGLPVAVFGDYVNNTEATDKETGFMAGVEFGKAKAPGSASFAYDYRDLEANAVVGAFTDSDVGGGDTDIDGHRLKAKYQISKNWQLSLTWMINQIKGGATDYNRGQLDLIAKF